jgi:hypothetical protein
VENLLFRISWEKAFLKLSIQGEGGMMDFWKIIKRISQLSAVFCAFFATSSVAHAEGKNGIGVVIGIPTGLSFRTQIAPSHEIAAALGWHYSVVQAYVDYLNIHPKFIVDNGVAVSGYWGLGVFAGAFERIHARTLHDDLEMSLGLRVPLGLKYIFPGDRVEIFAELAPGLLLWDSTFITLTGAAGVRYLF